MDRHKFRPGAEGLEVRLVLSTFVNTSVGRVNTEVPLSTLQQRMQRIDRLPAFIRSIDRNADIPIGQPVSLIQHNLTLLLGSMHASARNGIVALNQQLRAVVKQQTVSEAQAASLNNIFGKVLLSGGANAQIVQNLQNSMNDMVRTTVRSVSTNSSIVANQYALVTQLALAMGKPLPAPGVPRLASSDDTPPKNDRKTTNPQPSLVGNYEKNTTVQIVAQSQEVLGTAQVPANGQYRVQIAAPLPPGTYTVRIRAVGPNNSLSLMSRPFRFTIVAATPKGPQAMMR